MYCYRAGSLLREALGEVLKAKAGAGKMGKVGVEYGNMGSNSVDPLCLFYSISIHTM